MVNTHATVLTHGASPQSRPCGRGLVIAHRKTWGGNEERITTARSFSVVTRRLNGGETVRPTGLINAPSFPGNDAVQFGSSERMTMVVDSANPVSATGTPLAAGAAAPLLPGSHITKRPVGQ